MAQFEIVSVGSEGQYTVKELIDVTGISTRIAVLTAQNSSLAVRNTQIESDLTALENELASVIASVEAYLAADPPDVENASKQTLYSHTVSRLIGQNNRELSANKIRIESNNKTIDALNDTLGQQDVIHDAVCIDGDDTLTVGQIVGSIEFNRYPADKGGGYKVCIRPGASSAYSAARDGIVRPARIMGPSELFVNQASMPSAQIWLPRYVAASVNSIDTGANSIDATAYAVSNNHPATWWEGSTPVRLAEYLLNNMPVNYLTCDSEAFEVGDQVVVEYINEQPTVIGFVDNPKPCNSYSFYAVITPLNYTSTNSIRLNYGSFEIDWGDGVFITKPNDGQPATGVASNADSGLITIRTNNNPTILRFLTNTFTDIDIQVSGTITNLSQCCFNLSNLNSFNIADTSNVNNFFLSWYGCTGLTSFPAINTTSATDLDSTWMNCINLTSFSLINTSTINTLNRTWQNCRNLTSFPLINTSSITDFTDAWKSCRGLTGFPLIDTSSGEIFDGTWHTCEGLLSFPALDFSSSQLLYQTWLNCLNLQYMPLIDTSIATTVSGVFSGCADLVCIGGIDTTSATVNGNNFLGCTSLINPTASEVTQIDTSPPGLDYVNSNPCP